ncbi:hypothetical protein FB440_105276 [Vibrio crassostreae]|uniref:hypothetical protein n=1 Tax=Vibrio TaxID=662 RepID=UPI000C819837|nr:MULTISPECIES: hypothetical protein [Vibrio]PMI87283.1 hypothetical protein BCU34_06020 [Vibrio sp. 10N.286.45.E10]PTO97857.1 hypothetical protein CWO08_04325 [Vibrio sp. 10N.286.48.B8]PTP09412.1 hypothetical protein CWO17_04780 [Vibrio sp. 10N.286.45.A3]PTQ04837.1 hypothetical protein CWO13_05060 [Vibrio sp. ZF 223]PTQ25110.1 hypothetical protein CWO24_04670 [Vibrio sp. 10N.286.46.E10]
MDKELLAKKLYCQRVNSLARGTELDGNILDEMWESKTPPTDAVKAIQPCDNHFEGASWLSRYLSRK